MARTSHSLQLLSCVVSLDGDEEDSDLRMLLDNKFVKYITIAAGVYTARNMCFEPAITTLLPTFPEGVWNYGYVAKDPQTGLPHFAEIAQKQFEGVTSIWHQTTVDHLDLTWGEKLFVSVWEATSS